MKKCLFLFASILLSLGLAAEHVFAVDCSQLDTNDKIVDFVKKSKESNPLLRKNLSTRIEMKTKDLAKKEQKRHLAQSIRFGDKRRLFFVEGPDAPNCAVSRGERDFICSECTVATNSLCRSFKTAENSTTIRGTNIDVADFNRLDDSHHSSVCEAVPKNPSYFKIVTKRTGGDSPYDTIVSYYDKDKEIPVIMNYYAKGVLRKVYRFFPKYYIQLEGEWLSTVARIRTTKGSEKKYVFETLVYVEKNKSGYHLYLEPKKDPLLKGANWNAVFNTN